MAETQLPSIFQHRFQICGPNGKHLSNTLFRTGFKFQREPELACPLCEFTLEPTPDKKCVRIKNVGLGAYLDASVLAYPQFTTTGGSVQ